MRVPSGTRLKNGGWLHRGAVRPAALPPPPPLPPSADWAGVAAEYAAKATPEFVAAAAAKLGVSAAALVALSVGRALMRDGVEALAFPMRDETRRVVGIRLRFWDGAKRAVRGSKSGLFIPEQRAGDDVCVCEGPTDAAALLTIGLRVIGRPQRCGCEAMLFAAVGKAAKRVLIVSDTDGDGMRDARETAHKFAAIMPTRLLVPPAKDVREWVKAGATSRDVMRAAGIVVADKRGQRNGKA